MPIFKPYLHPKQSGKIHAHNHTAYISLACLLMITGFILTTFTVTAWERPGPAAGSIGMSGTMPGTPPQKAATIDTPTGGQSFGQTPVTISGTCPVTTVVEVFKNNIFAGSSPCSDKGTYTMQIDLLVGGNTLMAKVYDALNQAGPDSNTVQVNYTGGIAGASSMTSLNFGGNQLLLNTDAVFRGIFPAQDMVIPIDILGGRAPYAVNIQWGDSTNKVISRPDNASFRTAHAYAKPGTYQLSIQATDADGRVAFLTVASIVNGQPEAAAAATTAKAEKSNLLVVLWPLYVGIVAVVASFWAGEWREKRILIKHGIIPA